MNNIDNCYKKVRLTNQCFPLATHPLQLCGKKAYSSDTLKIMMILTIMIMVRKKLMIIVIMMIDDQVRPEDEPGTFFRSSSGRLLH